MSGTFCGTQNDSGFSMSSVLAVFFKFWRSSSFFWLFEISASFCAEGSFLSSFWSLFNSWSRNTFFQKNCTENAQKRCSLLIEEVWFHTGNLKGAFLLEKNLKFYLTCDFSAISFGRLELSASFRHWVTWSSKELTFLLLFDSWKSQTLRVWIQLKKWVILSYRWFFWRFLQKIWVFSFIFSDSSRERTFSLLFQMIFRFLKIKAVSKLKWFLKTIEHSPKPFPIHLFLFLLTGVFSFAFFRFAK